jgi:hypothetical protein
MPDAWFQHLMVRMTRFAAGQVDFGRSGRAGQRVMRSDRSFERYLDRIESALRVQSDGLIATEPKNHLSWYDIGMVRNIRTGVLRSIKPATITREYDE